MASGVDLEALALALEGTEAAPHFDRTAFRVARIYATLAADGKSANLKLEPDEQRLRVELLPGAVAPVPGKWGEQGWTTVTLARITRVQLAELLRIAWIGARQKPKRPKRK